MARDANIVIITVTTQKHAEDDVYRHRNLSEINHIDVTLKLKKLFSLGVKVSVCRGRAGERDGERDSKK